MWVSKLALVTLFTDVNGFKDGFGSFAFRVGITPRLSALESYDIGTALQSSFGRIFTRQFTMVFLVLVLACAVYMCLRKTKGRVLYDNAAYLVVAAFPVLWIVAAANPMNIHSYFQYRLLLAFMVGIGFYLVGCLRPGAREKEREATAGDGGQ
jgi:hypothetical protein